MMENGDKAEGSRRATEVGEGFAPADISMFVCLFSWKAALDFKTFSSRRRG